MMNSENKTDRICPACGNPLGDDHECLDDRNLRDASSNRVRWRRRLIIDPTQYEYADTDGPPPLGTGWFKVQDAIPNRVQWNLNDGEQCCATIHPCDDHRHASTNSAATVSERFKMTAAALRDELPLEAYDVDATRNRVSELAEFLRYACDHSVLTDDETAAMLEAGDQFDWMARELVAKGWVTAT